MTTTPRRTDDVYLTPPDVVATVAEFLPGNLGRTLDPAAGGGVFEHVLGYRTRGSTWVNWDIRPNTGAPGLMVQDYLASRPFPGDESAYDTIITNPPFNLIEEFVVHSLTVWKPRRVVFLARLALLEGVGRYERLWRRFPPKQVVVLPRRPIFSGFGVADRWAYAWFLWGDVPGNGLAWTEVV